VLAVVVKEKEGCGRFKQSKKEGQEAQGYRFWGAHLQEEGNRRIQQQFSADEHPQGVRSRQK